jgi:HK97 family phage prohead protease
VIRKSFDAIETKVIDADSGLVDVMFSVTGNVDRQNDVVEPGAFTKALAAKTSVPVVYGHKWDDLDSVLGKSVSWTELMPGSPELPQSLLTKGYGGAKARIQFEMGVPSGRVAFTHVRNKNITEWSWAFDIDPTGEKFEDNVRHIKSVSEIYEITLALVGANPATTTMAFKAMVEAEALRPDDDEAEIIEVVKALIPLLAD